MPWAIFEVEYLIWQNPEPTLANDLANFHCFKLLNIEQIIKPSGHAETDITREVFELTTSQTWVEQNDHCAVQLVD